MLESNLVQINAQEAFTTSLLIAENCDNRSHESTIKLIRKYQADFEELGKLDFKSDLDFKSESSRQKGGQETIYCNLNEDQATYLITLFRNTPIVRKFKLRLVKEFRKALNEIDRLYANPPRKDLITDKRKAHNPMMTALVEMRTDLGKETDVRAFERENKLCNGVVTGKYIKADEKALSNEQIELLGLVRKRNEAFLLSGLDYKERKKRLLEFVMRHNTKLIQ